MRLTNSTVPSGECSKQTKRRRTNEISKVREYISVGNSKEQMANEIEMLPKAERNELMKEVNFTLTVPPGQGLAMKSDLCLSWRKLRIMRR